MTQILGVCQNFSPMARTQVGAPDGVMAPAYAFTPMLKTPLKNDTAHTLSKKRLVFSLTKI